MPNCPKVARKSSHLEQQREGKRTTKSIHASVVLLASLALSLGCASATGLRRHAASAAVPPPFVKCVGQFTDYEADYPWFEKWVDENGNESHGDGSSPRATFRISTPAIYADRIVGVLYRCNGRDLPPPPALAAKGRTFSFELPEDFFAGKYVTIDNINVRNLRMEP